MERTTTATASKTTFATGEPRDEEHTIDTLMGTRASVPAPERKEVAEKKKMAKRKGSSAPSCSRARKKAAKGDREAEVDRDAREAENAQRLDKLPPEMWEKVLDNLDENDLFPLARSCRYFRQKQKELVARPRQSGPGSGEPRRFALKTTLRKGLDPHKPGPEPTSADYLRFCSKEKVPRLPITNYNCLSTSWINWLAAYHGHLPLLQELLAGRKKLNGEVIAAGESSSSQSLLLFVALTSDSFLSSSQRREANWRPCSG